MIGEHAELSPEWAHENPPTDPGNFHVHIAASSAVFRFVITKGGNVFPRTIIRLAMTFPIGATFFFFSVVGRGPLSVGSGWLWPSLPSAGRTARQREHMA